jgi:hypothetical protein
MLNEHILARIIKSVKQDHDLDVTLEEVQAVYNHDSEHILQPGALLAINQALIEYGFR